LVRGEEGAEQVEAPSHPRRPAAFNRKTSFDDYL